MEVFENLCKGCMKEIGENNICPFCGYDQNEVQGFPYLRKGSVLEDRYVLGKAVGKNGEGIGYIAFDKVSNTSVYIKEFFPEKFCVRADDGFDVKVNEGFEEKFNDGLDSFLTYLRAVARLRSLSAVVPIYDIFAKNSTAYAVYEWVDGVKFTDFLLKKDDCLSWNVAKSLFMPLLSSLSEMNSVGVHHLGICPKNLIVTNEGKLKLINFSIPEIRESDSGFSPELYDGYSALEQYVDDYPISEFTDIYSFAATLFFSLTGLVPQKATRRKKDERLFIPKNLLKKIPRHVISALAKALRVYPDSRTCTFEDLRRNLSDSYSLIKYENLYEDFIRERNQRSYDDDNDDEKTSKSHFVVVIICAILALLAFVAAGTFWLFGNSFNFNSNSKDDISSIYSQESSSSYVSSGAYQSKIKAPKFVGLMYEDIQGSQDFGCQILMASEEFSDTVKQGAIISQTPKENEEIEKGSTVLVVVSKGSKMRTLPPIVGLSISDASQKISDAGLVPIQKQGNSDTVPPGVVIGYENHAAGDKAEYKSEVTVIVSKGS